MPSGFSDGVMTTTAFLRALAHGSSVLVASRWENRMPISVAAGSFE